MVESSNEVYSEVLGVLLALGNKYVGKLPLDLMQFLIENSTNATIPVIDRNKGIEEQDISEEARIFLTMLKMKYWCETEDEKNEILNTLKENEKMYQDELRKKYNVDDLFGDKYKVNSLINEEKESSIEVIKFKKKNFFVRLFERIFRHHFNE